METERPEVVPLVAQVGLSVRKAEVWELFNGAKCTSGWEEYKAASRNYGYALSKTSVIKEILLRY